MDDAGRLLSWPLQDSRALGRLVLTGLLWLGLSLTIVGIPLAAINLTGWMLGAVDNLRLGRAEVPPAGFYLRRGFRLFCVQLAYLMVLLAVCGGLVVAGLRIGGIGGGLIAIFGQSLLLLGSTLLVAVTPGIILLAESGGIRGGLSVPSLLRLIAADPRSAVAAGLMCLLCLDIISPLGLLLCGLGLVMTTPYAYAVLASTVVACENRNRR